MLIESVFMELRARLRSCNVYIITGVDLKKDCNLKINLQSNGIILNYTNECDSEIYKRKDSCSSIESLSDCYSEDDSDVTMVIPIEDFCKIIPNSMSGLKIDRNNISFRILTEPIDGGNFYKELLSPKIEELKIEAAKLKVNVKANEKLKIICANCSNVVSDGLIKFDRVLELPTENLDMSEWFCHDHGPKTEKIQPLEQRKFDFLYRLTFFVVNSTEMSEKTNKFNLKRDVYHCNRCLAWLGLKSVSKSTVKLFNSTVKIDQEGTESYIFAHKSLVQNSHIEDFIYTIESLTREFNLGFQYTVMCKIVIECSISNKKQYLLVWIMDKQLQVLHSGNSESQDSNTVELKSSFLTKILYKTEESLNEEVETWLADPSVVSTEISKSMFVAGSEHLNKMSMKIPASFRSTNGFTVSFLNM